jgi:hypothetical protein
MDVKLGVFLSNTKSRRAKLTADKLAVLAALGLEWAADDRAPASADPPEAGFRARLWRIDARIRHTKSLSGTGVG